MGKSRSKAPSAPNPTETAQAESQFNRLDTFSPSGSGTRHGFTNDQGKFQSGVVPEGQQAAVNYQESDTERQLREALEPASVDLTNRIISDNVSGLPDAARVQDRGTVANDIFNRNFSLMAPGIDRANERLLTNLQARGMPVGSEGFNEAYGDQVRQTQDTISRLAQDANIAAGQEQSRQFGLDSAQRSGAIAELVAAMGGGYNPPNAVPSGAAPGVNFSGLAQNAYQADLANYHQNQQNKLGAAQAVGSAGAALLKCDLNAKEVVGTVYNNVVANRVAQTPIYAWNYKNGEAPTGDHGETHIGPMAQDFHRIFGFGSDKEINVIDYLGVVLSALQNAIHRIEVLEVQTGLSDPLEYQPEQVH